MHQIRVLKEVLLAKLKANLASHRDLFLKAQEVYREEVIAELDNMLKEARDGKKIKRAVLLPEPIDKTDEYQQVIGMLEMDTGTHVELDSQQYQNFVMDKWGWSASVYSQNSSYSAKLKS